MKKAICELNLNNCKLELIAIVNLIVNIIMNENT